MPGPYFIICANPTCEQVKQVRRPSDQQRHRFCSRKCSAIVVCNITKVAGAARLGGLAKAKQAQRAVVARVQGLTPLAAFRLGYDRGLQSKHRQLRKRSAAA